MSLRPSLFRHLLLWSLGTVVAVWLSFVLVGFRTGVHEADELTDGHLASVAALILAQQVGELVGTPDPAAGGGLADLRAHDYQQSLTIVEWDAQGRLLVKSGQAPTPAFTEHEGFENLELGQPPRQWRAFSRWEQPGRAKKVTVLLSLAERDDLADDIAHQVAAPGLWLLPVVALVLIVAVRTGLMPLDALTRNVERLDVRGRQRLVGPPHREFVPVTRSINTLIERYNAALERERSLASEVAHELRTPLASLSLQAAALRGPLSAAERDSALARIERDAVRAGDVLNQLLALARASRAELAEAMQTADLSALARGVAAEFGQAAHASGHRLSVDVPQACPALVHPLLVEIGLRNLIENALAHTPRGSAIEVRVSAQPPSVEVRDDGNSRAPAAAGAPPHAVLGWGLGHQVVARVAAAHGGRLETLQAAGGYRIRLGADDPA